jgi:hypothetical protein
MPRIYQLRFGATNPKGGRSGGILSGFVKALLGITIVVAVLLAMLVAWWIALLAAGGWLLFTGLRRMLGGRPTPARPENGGDLGTVIDGEYRVEGKDTATPPPAVIDLPVEAPRENSPPRH